MMEKIHYLKEGRLAENIRKRSVLNKFVYRSKKMQLAPGTGRAGSRVKIGNDVELVVSTGTVASTYRSSIQHLFCCIRNDLLCMGVIPTGFLQNLLLIKSNPEEMIRETMADISTLAKKYEMDYLGGDVQMSYGAQSGSCSFTMFGEPGTSQSICNTRLEPGMDLVMTKFAGICGTVYLTERDFTQKLTYLPEELLENAWKFGNEVCGQKEAEIAWQEGVTAMQNTSEGGIFGDLWCFAEASGVGIEVDLKAIPIRQETIEICEAYDLNPYMIPAGGAFLNGTYHGEELVEKMCSKGCPAAVIGGVTENKERVVVHGDERRALLPPSNEKEGNVYLACRIERKR